MERAPRDRYAHLFTVKSNQELRAILGWSYNAFTRAVVRRQFRYSARGLRPNV